MNIEQARTIPITLILDKINLAPQRTKGDEVTYFSPLLRKKKPTLWINTKKNVWYDHGLKTGGNIIAFAVRYLQSQGMGYAVSDALRYLENTSEYVPFIHPVTDPASIIEGKTLSLRNVKEIEEKALIHYAGKRGIPEVILRKYMKQAQVFNSKSKKDLFALCMKNEDSGYELRNPFFNGYLGKRNITFIRGTENNYDGIHIFRDVFDYLSFMTQRNDEKMKDDTIILHSLNCLRDGVAYIKGFGYRTAYTWMDNNDSGRKAILSWNEFFAKEQNLVHHPMNDLYENFETVNEAHINKVSLSLKAGVQ